MKIRRNIAAVAAAIIAVCSFASCGSSDSSKAEQGTLPGSAAQTSAPAETNAPENTEAPATDAPKSSDAPASSGSFAASKTRVKYNGKEFGTGDNINDIKGDLGSEAAPATDAASCLTGNTIKEYYFNGMSIQATNDGVIFAISFTEDLYAGRDAETVDGIKLGSKVDDVKAALGEPGEVKGKSLVYTDGTTTMSVTARKEEVNTILITDSALDK